MKTAKWVLLAGMVLMLLTIGCEKQMGFIEPNRVDANIGATSTLPHQYNPDGNWFTYFHYMPPVADPGIVYAMSVGNDDGGTGCNVRVWNDAANLYVEYNALNGWKLGVVHVAVATTHDGIPHNKKGNMVPGNFPYPLNKEFDVDPPATQHLVTIPWESSWDNPEAPGLYMVAHSEVFWVDPITGDTTWETGCGSDTVPDDSIPEDPNKTIKLPDFPVTINITRNPYTGLERTARYNFGVDLTGTGYEDAESSPFNVWNDLWGGWCADKNTGMPDSLIGVDIEVMLYSCYDPALPERFQNDGWPKVSWLVNEYSGATYEHWDYFVHDMKNVIWYLLGQITGLEYLENDTQRAMAMAADAHPDYYPELAGQWFAVIVDAGTRPIQPLFIQVDP